MGFFMNWGPVVCSAFCGAFFLGTGALAVAWLLRPEEVKVFGRGWLWVFAGIAFFSQVVLMLMGSGGILDAWAAEGLMLLVWSLSAWLASEILFLGIRRLKEITV